MDREEIKDKVRKLLRLSESPNESEAKLALEKAYELMMKWAIEEHELNKGKPTEFIKAILYGGKQLPYEVRSTGANILHEYFNVKCIVVTYTGPSPVKHALVAFGTKDAIENAGYVFNFLMDTYNRLWCRTAFEMGLGREQRKPYIAGLIRGFREYLESQRKRVESQCKDLIVIGKELTEAFKKTYPNQTQAAMPVKAKNVLSFAVHAKGHQDGKNIRITKPLEHSKKEQIGD